MPHGDPLGALPPRPPAEPISPEAAARMATSLARIEEDARALRESLQRQEAVLAGMGAFFDTLKAERERKAKAWAEFAEIHNKVRHEQAERFLDRSAARHARREDWPWPKWYEGAAYVLLATAMVGLLYVVVAGR